MVLIFGIKLNGLINTTLGNVVLQRNFASRKEDSHIPLLNFVFFVLIWHQKVPMTQNSFGLQLKIK
jgi:hypothetical protein